MTNETRIKSYAEQVAPLPAPEESVTAEAALKFLLSRALNLQAVTEKLNRPAFDEDTAGSPETRMALKAYMYALLAGSHATHAASVLRALMKADPKAAQEQAVALAVMWDEGDAQEWAWEWAVETGLNPDRLYGEHLAWAMANGEGTGSAT